jgi:3-deoxy-D-manno-octulosonate 8-phosphate phosphatase (KDO 8-P phosphatase)
MDAKARAARIKLVAFDIDGVMTDGGLHYTDDGGELKTFNVQDGLGLKLMQRAGIELAIVTGRTSGVVAARAADLGIEHVYQGVANKRTTVGGLLETLGLNWADCAFMGDDLIDLPAMTQCGFAIAPANARAVVKERAHAVTDASGGHGAVREAIEFILEAQGKLDAAFAPYLDAQ